MSVEDLKKFGQLCQDDETVRARAKKIGINDPAGLMEYAAKELDLEFTQDDMMELAKETGVSKDELSEEDLEKIAGGVVTATAVVGAAIVGGAVVGAVATVGLAVGTLAVGGFSLVGAVASKYW